MTSDAKIGLLLGLVFIFIIAFVINGVPNFYSDKNNNELTTTMFNSQNEALGLAAGQRKVIEQNEPITKYPPAVQRPPKAEPDTRFEMPLPKRTLDRKEGVEVKSVTPPQSPPIAKNEQKQKVQPKKTTLPKVYVVAVGDNLSAIAKNCYGDTEGNRLINITRIFQANRKLLKSADEIYEGQKITIPPLPFSASDKSKIKGVFPSTMFEKVKSIGKRHLSNDDSKAKQSRLYIVREGDSLWRIAAERLGDATLYSEVAKLNADILPDEDSLTVGMRLKLPAR